MAKKLFILLSLALAGSPALSDDYSTWGAREIPTPLLTGNGFGFAVYSVRDGFVAKFFAHPYLFAKPDPTDPLSEGVQTDGFIKKLKWESSVPAPRSADVLNDSHVIAIRDHQGEEIDFMPFGINRNVLITQWRPRTGGEAACLRLEWKAPPASKTYFPNDRGQGQILSFKNSSEKIALIPMDGPGAETGNGCLGGASAWALAYVENASEISGLLNDLRVWRDRLTPDQWLKRELRQFENWRARPRLHFTSAAERKVWRRSETMLRMAQIREPNRPDRHGHGLLLAGLPDGIWVVPWVRDMTYATRALIRMGHKAEARDALEALFEARPVGRMQADVRGFPYQISVVRYFGDGSEEPFFTMEGADNVELDGWGLVLDALAEYVQRFGDEAFLSTATYRGSIYSNALKFVVDPLLGNLDPVKGGLIVTQDTSIWEERQEDGKHFAFTSAAAIQGLRGFVGLARLKGDIKTARRISKVLGPLERGFANAFIRDGFVHGTMEDGFKNEVDIAVLEAIAWGVVTDRKVIDRTMEKMELLKVASGGYRRVRGDTEYEQHEFLLSDINWARVNWRRGEKASAGKLIETIVKKSVLDHGFLPEMYVARINNDFKGEVGDPTGAVPLVGFGPGAFVLYMTERESNP
jgi:hypothetical protein